MATVVTPPEQRIVLDDIPWDVYERLLAANRDRSAPRFTYDRGTLLWSAWGGYDGCVPGSVSRGPAKSQLDLSKTMTASREPWSGIRVIDNPSASEPACMTWSGPNRRSVAPTPGRGSIFPGDALAASVLGRRRPRLYRTGRHVP
jgi:hypothetical protein